MIVFFFTASSISRKQTSYKDRNVIEENNDWIIFHSVSIYEMLAMKSPVIVMTNTTLDDNLVTAEPLTDQAIKPIIGTVRGSQPDEVVGHVR